MENSLANSPVLVALISTVGGMGVAYITYVVSQRVQKRRAAGQPKDRMEQMFDGYERLIKQKDLEDDRKQKYISVIEKELGLTKEHVTRLENALEATNDELVQSRKENKELKGMLDAMRKEYKTVKSDTMKS